MSTLAAIDLAVLLELVSQRKPDYDDYKRVMGDDSGAGADAIPGYHYDKPGVEAFLQRIAMRLRCDTPPLNFDWVAVEPERCLTANRETLINLIARATRPEGDK